MRLRAFAFSLAAITVMFLSSAGATQPKQQICHIPPDDPENAHTISISEKALDAHLAHGDCLGECPCAECQADGDCAASELCDSNGECSESSSVMCECQGVLGVFYVGPCQPLTECLALNTFAICVAQTTGCDPNNVVSYCGVPCGS